MSYNIYPVASCERQIKRLAKKYNSFAKDLIVLKDELQRNPHAGADLGQGVHKVRMAISDKNKGRSHGARVITYVVSVDIEAGTIYLLSIYDKEEQSTITKQEPKIRKQSQWQSQLQ